MGVYAKYIDNKESDLQRYFIMVSGYRNQVGRLKLIDAAGTYKRVYGIDTKPEVVNIQTVMNLLQEQEQVGILLGTLEQLKKETEEIQKRQREEMKKQILEGITPVTPTVPDRRLDKVIEETLQTEPSSAEAVLVGVEEVMKNQGYDFRDFLLTEQEEQALRKEMGQTNKVTWDADATIDTKVVKVIDMILGVFRI